jgi:hypothetical protein
LDELSRDDIEWRSSGFPADVGATVMLRLPGGVEVMLYEPPRDAAR